MYLKTEYDIADIYRNRLLFETMIFMIWWVLHCFEVGARNMMQWWIELSVVNMEVILEFGPKLQLVV